MKLIYHPSLYQESTLELSSFLNLDIQQTQHLLQKPLISDYELSLPVQVYKNLSQFAKTLALMTQMDPYQNFLWSRAPDNFQKLKAPTPLNPGFSGCLDFHLDPMTGALKLIEVNTNASFYALSLFLKTKHKHFSPLGPPEHSAEEIKKNFYQVINSNMINRIFITDDMPEQQKLYIEFLIYKKLFSDWGHETQIADIRELRPTDGDYIYNRSTDFYLTIPESQNLFNFWMSNPLNVTPNPINYYFFADKQRLIDWTSDEFLQILNIKKEFESLAPFLPKSLPMNQAHKEELWHDRKKWFFKPQTSFGSRMTYRGQSISKSHFSMMFDNTHGPCIAQEFVPAGELSSPHHGNMKFDLRCYYHQGNINHCVARIYQGQVTNSKTPGGGFTPIHWE